MSVIKVMTEEETQQHVAVGRAALQMTETCSVPHMEPQDYCLGQCRTEKDIKMAVALMMEAARTSETLVNFYQTTRCYNPEDSHLRTHRRANLKSYLKDTNSKHMKFSFL
jgi:hypothetical protein